jgi:hypothetical protein
MSCADSESRTFSAASALAMVKGEKTLAELARLFKIHPNQSTAWKSIGCGFVEFHSLDHAAAACTCTKLRKVEKV